MARVTEKFEINFETGSCEETLRQKTAYIAERMRSIKNPYTGNKKKLVVDIFTAIEKHGYKFASMLDLFCGSASVSIAAKHLGKKVYSNDLMKFAYYHAKAFVENQGTWLSVSDMTWLRNNRLPSCGSFVRDNYAERFTPEEALLLDSYRANIVNRWPVDSVQFAVAMLQLLHYVMENCFIGGRLNKGQVLADRDHRLNHSRNQGVAMSLLSIPHYCFDIDSPVSGHKSFNRDAIELLSSGDANNVDLCYIDPPYGAEQSNYFIMYRFFEEYIAGQKVEPNENTSKFVSTSNYDSHFEQLLDAARNIPTLVFSYNDSSWSSIEDIEKIIKRFRQKVIVENVEYPYKYRDQKSSAKEYIVLVN